MRVLIHQSRAGCVIGKAGAKIKELREVSEGNGFKITDDLFIAFDN